MRNILIAAALGWPACFGILALTGNPLLAVLGLYGLPLAAFAYEMNKL